MHCDIIADVFKVVKGLSRKYFREITFFIKIGLKAYKSVLTNPVFCVRIIEQKGSIAQLVRVLA